MKGGGGGGGGWGTKQTKNLIESWAERKLDSNKSNET